jgi:hypothetical protein
MRVGKSGIGRDGLLKKLLGPWIIAYSALNDSIEIENLSIVRTFCEELWAHGARGIYVVRENENAKQLQLGVLITRIGVDDVLSEIDRVLVANLLDQDDHEGP